jgi:metaxin
VSHPPATEKTKHGRRRTNIEEPPNQLHALYLNQSNLPTLRSLYLPRSPLIAYPIHQSLQAAATAEILRATRASCVFPRQLLADADDALGALSTLLGDHDWFFGVDGPGLFDAEVFAYTYLLLDPAMGWHDDALATALRQLDNLVAHRARLYKRCWGGEEGK